MSIPSVRRKRLRQGLSALETAIACLEITPDERVALNNVLESNLNILVQDGSSATEPQPKPRSAATSGVEDADLKPTTKKQIAAERARIIRMYEQKAQAKRDEVHKRSGYTSYVRRLPGSFEGGKK